MTKNKSLKLVKIFILWTCLFLLKIKATGLEACDTVISNYSSITSTDDSCSPSIYCSDGDNIYGFDEASTATCKKKLGEGVHVFNTNDKSIVDITGSIDISSYITNIVLYNCNASKCVQTYGFIKVNGAFYKIVKTGSNEAVPDFSSINSCTAANLATISSESVLCLTNDIPVEFISSGSKNYLMSNTANNIFTEATTNNDKFIVIQATPNAFTYNSLLTGEGYYITDNKNAIMQTYSENEGTLYSCTVTSEVMTCDKKTSSIPIGYLLNADTISNTIIPYIECSLNSGTTKCYAINITETGCDNRSNIGKLIKDTSGGNPLYKLCVNYLIPIPLAETTGEYMTSKENGNVFGSSVTEEFVITKFENGSVTLLDSANGYYVADDTNLSIVNAVNNSGNLYECTDSNCVRIYSPIGYYANANPTNKDAIPYFQCLKNGASYVCTALSVNNGSDCTSASAGSIYKGTDSKYYLCVKEDATPLDLNSSSGQYIINAFDEDTSKFTLMEISGGNVIKISGENYSGNFLADSTTNAVVTTNNGSGILFSCSMSICNPADANNISTGYIINSGNGTSGTAHFIKCTKGVTTCTGVNAPVGSGCSAVDLFYSVTGDPNTYYYCLQESGSGIEIGGKNGGYYFISINTANVFGDSSGHYTMIKIDENSILSYSIGDSPNRYEYADSSDKHIDDFDSQYCESGELKSSVTVVEYKLVALKTDTTPEYYEKEQSS